MTSQTMNRWPFFHYFISATYHITGFLASRSHHMFRLFIRSQWIFLNLKLFSPKSCHLSVHRSNSYWHNYLCKKKNHLEKLAFIAVVLSYSPFQWLRYVELLSFSFSLWKFRLTLVFVSSSCERNHIYISIEWISIAFYEPETNNTFVTSSSWAIDRGNNDADFTDFTLVCRRKNICRLIRDRRQLFDQLKIDNRRIQSEFFFVNWIETRRVRTRAHINSATANGKSEKERRKERIETLQ